MALIVCKECGAEVSDKAISCVKCGCPIKMPNTTLTVRASSEFIGLACSYAVYDEDGEFQGQFCGDIDNTSEEEIWQGL